MQITNTKASRGDKTKELVSLTKNKYFGIYGTLGDKAQKHTERFFHFFLFLCRKVAATAAVFNTTNPSKTV